MLRISAEDKGEMLVLRLAGQVRDQWVEELRRSFEEALVRRHGRASAISLDLAEVTFIDASGLALFARLARRGAALANYSPFSAAQLHEVLE